MFRKIALLLLSLVLVTIPLLVVGTGCSSEPPRVLIVYSYNAEFDWVIEEERGVSEIFQGKDFEIKRVYLDTKRQTSAEWFAQVSTAAVKTIDEFKPDLLMVFDDNACALVGKRYVGSDLPVVFAGVNADPAVYNFPAANVTGVMERYDVPGAVELLKQVVPGIKKAAILIDESVTSDGIIEDIQSNNPSVEIVYYRTSDFTAWQSYLNTLQTQVDAIGLFQYHTLKDNASGASLPPQEVLGWTLAHNQLPEFTFFDFVVSDGVLMGLVTSGYEQGKAGAAIALRIIDGEKPGDIAVQKPIKGITMVNQERAAELHITIPAAVLEKAVVVP